MIDGPAHYIRHNDQVPNDRRGRSHRHNLQGLRLLSTLPNQRHPESPAGNHTPALPRPRVCSGPRCGDDSAGAPQHPARPPGPRDPTAIGRWRWRWRRPWRAETAWCSARSLCGSQQSGGSLSCDAAEQKHVEKHNRRDVIWQQTPAAPGSDPGLTPLSSSCSGKHATLLPQALSRSSIHIVTPNRSQKFPLSKARHSIPGDGSRTNQWGASGYSERRVSE